MATSGSYARGDQPRTVSDPDAEAYEQMIRKQRALAAQREAQEAARRAQSDDAQRRAHLLGDRMFDAAGEGLHPTHPNFGVSLIPVLGPGLEAAADLEDRDYVGAVGNAAVAITDAIPAKAIVGGALKGGMKAAGPFAWKSKPWEVAGMRKWLGAKGFLEKGQHGHHWLIPQNGWGKTVPDFIKNQPWNIKGLDAVTHGRIHGRYTVDGVKLPRFGDIGRLWHGSPDYAKALASSGVARARNAMTTRRPGSVPPLLMD